MGSIGQVCDVVKVFPIERPKGGAKTQQATVPWDVAKNISETKRLLLDAGDKVFRAAGAVAHLIEVGHPSSGNRMQLMFSWKGKENYEKYFLTIIQHLLDQDFYVFSSYFPNNN